MIKPDVGWAWAVTIASFVIQVIIDGVKYSFGIMFIELVDTFHESKSKTSWVMSIQIGVMLLSGPLIAIMVNRIGCKSTVVIGTIASAGGFIASAFVTSVYALYFSFGLLAGFGFGMMNLPCRVMIIKYFDKRLAFATGFVNMGTGVGALIFNPLSNVLIDTYTWRGTLIIEAGIILNGIVCALVLQQPKYSCINTNRDEVDKTEEKKLIDRKLNLLVTNDIIENCDLRNHDKLGENRHSINSTEIYFSKNVNAYHHIDNTTSKVYDVFKDCKGKNIDFTLSSVSNRGSLESINDDCDNNYTSVKHVTEIDMKKSNKTCVNVMPLKNPGFITFLSGNFLIDLSLNIPIAFIPDMMYQKGFKIQEAVWIIFVIGVVSTISRLGIGIIADLPVINRVKVCNSLIALSGCVVIIGPFCSTFASFAAFAIFYGILSGSSNSLRGILIPDLFGSETIADHIGIAMFTSGLAALVSLPISGAIYDMTGSYRLPFIIAGIELMTSGSLMFLIPTIQKYHSRSVQQ